MRMWPVVLCLCFVVSAWGGSLDPCDPINYNELDEPHRSTGYTVASGDDPMCDIHLQKGWYRFTAGSGGTMPEACPPPLSCGTVVPIWMNGSHPSVSDGTQIRDVCANFNSGDPHQARGSTCCEMKQKIAVRNCGSYFVYFLSPTISCPMSYCVGHQTPCPAGKWSPTGLPPCTDAYPPLTATPTLSDPILSGSGNCFRFDCTVRSGHHDPNQRFEVIWTFDGKEDPMVPPVVISDPQRVVSLSGSQLKGHVNSMVGCQVRTYFEGNRQQKGPLSLSNTYYAGVEITPGTPGRLEVGEKDFEKNITIASTIPILCNHNTTCCLVFKLDVDQSTEMSIQTQCDWSLCSTDWNPKTGMASIQVPVVANQDLINDGNKQLMLSFEKLIPGGGGQCLGLFDGHRPDPIPVETVDAFSATCTIRGDPHIHGFEFETYHLYKLGDFAVCQVPSKNFDVQIRTWACGVGGSHATCLCGVTIREDNDVIKIDQCDQQYHGRHTSPTIDVGHGVRNGTVIQRSKCGKIIAVYLPSGSQIKVWGNNQELEMQLTVSGRYFQQCKGICGTNDDNKHNEFMFPNGTVYNPSGCSTHSRGHGHGFFSHRYSCRPNEFFEAWRLPQSSSLFEHIPAVVPTTDEVKYCACRDNYHGSPAINCTIRGDVPANGRPNLCRGCPSVPAKCSPLDPLCNSTPGWVRHRRALGNLYTDDDVEDAPYVLVDMPDAPDKQWPADDGTTEAEARTACLQVLAQAQLYSACQHRDSFVEALVEDCLEDMLMSGSRDFLDSISDSATSRCQSLLALDPASYVSAPDGQSVMKPQYVDEVCLYGCQLHGKCGPGGKCVCQHGWEGDQCHLQTGVGPVLDRIRSGPLCDLTSRPCQKVYIDASNLDHSDDLSCKIQLVDGDSESEWVDQEVGQEDDAVEHQVGQVIITEAVSLSAHRISCDIPKTTRGNQLYRVSASNDGILFGNSLSLRVFDSSCMDCSVGGCKHKGLPCEIATTTSLPAPSLTGPDSDHLVTCKMTSSHVAVTSDIPVHVNWLVDGREVTSQSRPIGKRQQLGRRVGAEATFSLMDLPGSGQLTCQVQVGEAKSPQSTSIDLATTAWRDE